MRLGSYVVFDFKTNKATVLKDRDKLVAHVAKIPMKHQIEVLEYTNHEPQSFIFIQHNLEVVPA